MLFFTTKRFLAFSHHLFTLYTVQRNITYPFLSILYCLKLKKCAQDKRSLWRSICSIQYTSLAAWTTQSYKFIDAALDQIDSGMACVEGIHYHIGVK